MKGIYLQKLGQSKTALEFLLTAINSNYVTSATLFHLGLAYKDIGERSKALSAFKSTLSVEPTHKEAAQNLKLLSS